MSRSNNSTLWKALQKGEKVAIVSPSSTLAAQYPWVFELGLQRLRGLFAVEPVVMPNCLNANASWQDKADDIHQSFSDKNIKAIIATIGGIDQIRLIKHLDQQLIANNKKPFFGYSDNTHFCNYLFANNIPSFYGASVMTQYAMQTTMCQETIDSINWALFAPTTNFIIKPAAYTIDEDLPWSNPDLLSTPRPRVMDDTEIVFINALQARGQLWGGCLESLNDLFHCPTRLPHDFSNLVLFVETSEEMPSAEFVRRFFVSIGEAGVLSQIKALLVGKAKAWSFQQQFTFQQRQQYRTEQILTIANVMAQYNHHIPIVFNLPIGHSDPQVVLPYGGMVEINGLAKTISISM